MTRAFELGFMNAIKEADFFEKSAGITFRKKNPDGTVSLMQIGSDYGDGTGKYLSKPAPGRADPTGVSAPTENGARFLGYADVSKEDAAAIAKNREEQWRRNTGISQGVPLEEARRIHADNLAKARKEWRGEVENPTENDIAYAKNFQKNFGTAGLGAEYDDHARGVAYGHNLTGDEVYAENKRLASSPENRRMIAQNSANIAREAGNSQVARAERARQDKIMTERGRRQAMREWWGGLTPEQKQQVLETEGTTNASMRELSRNEQYNTVGRWYDKRDSYNFGGARGTATAGTARPQTQTVTTQSMPATTPVATPTIQGPSGVPNTVNPPKPAEPPKMAGTGVTPPNPTATAPLGQKPQNTQAANGKRRQTTGTAV